MSSTLKNWMQTNLARTTTATTAKRVSISQMHFVEHMIGDLFLPSEALPGEYLADSCYVQVVGEHVSKEAVLPVYAIITPQIEVYLRGNFYDWTVCVWRPEDANPLNDLISPAVWRMLERQPGRDSIQFEGIPQHIIDRSEAQFTVVSDYDLYALMLDLANEIHAS